MTEHEPAAAVPRLHLVARSLFRGTPVWAFRAGMFLIQRSETKRMNVDPVAGVAHTDNIDYAGDGHPAHRLDVIAPIPAADATDSRATASPAAGGTDARPLLPVYIYFHGGGWTSGDKTTVTKYCAHQAATGMVVVNVNYRRAGRFQMDHQIQDAGAAVRWVRENIRTHGGDPDRVVLGGDSAGGHIAALFTATSGSQELRAHFGMPAEQAAPAVQGLVLHCSAVDFSMFFAAAPILGRGFVRLLQPRSTTAAPARRATLREAATYLSPIEWIGPGHPAVFVTTSARDYFYESNLRFVERLRAALVPVETIIYGSANANTLHTWQQNYRFPESQTVWEHVTAFVNRVTALAEHPISLEQSVVGEHSVSLA
ncbi:MAG: acetyl esterase [Subtercola sp.]|nr:acetyl esterase [Subtercola sp.]